MPSTSWPRSRLVGAPTLTPLFSVGAVPCPTATPRPNTRAAPATPATEHNIALRFMIDLLDLYLLDNARLAPRSLTANRSRGSQVYNRALRAVPASSAQLCRRAPSMASVLRRM